MPSLPPSLVGVVIVQRCHKPHPPSAKIPHKFQVVCRKTSVQCRNTGARTSHLPNNLANHYRVHQRRYTPLSSTQPIVTYSLNFNVTYLVCTMVLADGRSAHVLALALQKKTTFAPRPQGSCEILLLQPPSLSQPLFPPFQPRRGPRISMPC